MPPLPVFARHVAVRTAAYGGGGVGLLGMVGYGIITAQTRFARRAVPALGGAPPADGEYGDAPHAPLRIAILGDSTAAGLGADVPTETPGALLAADVAAATGRRVALDVVAVPGTRSADLEPQVSRALLTPPHIAVICVGANDVIRGVSSRRAARDLELAVRRLRAAGARVVVGTCPDLGALCFVPQPLRLWGQVRSATMAAAQRGAVEAADGVVVPLGQLLGRAFRADATMFCRDRFHPSGVGYAALAAVLSPFVRAAAAEAAVPWAPAVEEQHA